MIRVSIFTCSLAVVCLTLACNPFPQKDAQVNDPTVFTYPGHTGVENGTAYDRAVLVLKEQKTLIIPEDAVVWTGESCDQVHIFMEKKQSYKGHHSEDNPVSIRRGRKEMGCAVKQEGDAIVLATYGEWDSNIEGGVFMNVLLEVPKGVEIIRRPKLSSPISLAGMDHDWNPNKGRKGIDARLRPPESGWKALPNIPDPNLRARSKD